MPEIEIIRTAVALGHLRTLAEGLFGELVKAVVDGAAMTQALHPTLAAGRWYELTLMEQLGNIGSDVGRATRAKEQGNEPRFAGALDRALELFDLTLADARWRGLLKEIARAREVVCDFLVGDNEYGSTAESLDSYFLPFAMAARRDR